MKTKLTHIPSWRYSILAFLIKAIYSPVCPICCVGLSAFLIANHSFSFDYKILILCRDAMYATNYSLCPFLLQLYMVMWHSWNLKERYEWWIRWTIPLLLSWEFYSEIIPQSKISKISVFSYLDTLMFPPHFTFPISTDDYFPYQVWYLAGGINFPSEWLHVYLTARYPFVLVVKYFKSHSCSSLCNTFCFSLPSASPTLM